MELWEFGAGLVDFVHQTGVFVQTLWRWIYLPFFRTGFMDMYEKLML